MPTNLLVPPSSAQRVTFAPGFGQRVLLTVDTEEEFDWNGPFTRDDHGTSHFVRLHRFQEFCEGLGVVPVYLVDWPVTRSPLAAEILGTAAREGRAEIGVQLHPWVNPPFEEKVDAHNSYAGNLAPELEAEKFGQLHSRISEVFGVRPLIYRAGRYGLGPASDAMLKNAGIAVDTSVRSLFDYSAGHGPNYRRHPLLPYWSDETRSLIELPVTSVYWGMLRRQGAVLHPLAERFPLLGGLLSRLALLERISLTPEGVTKEEALRGIDIAIDDGLPVIVLSFHSPSLAPGNIGYVRTEDDLDRLYDWFRGVYAYLELRGVMPTTTAEIIAAARP